MMKISCEISVKRSSKKEKKRESEKWRDEMKTHSTEYVRRQPLFGAPKKATKYWTENFYIIFLSLQNISTEFRINPFICRDLRPNKTNNWTHKEILAMEQKCFRVNETINKERFKRNNVWVKRETKEHKREWILSTFWTAIFGHN